MRLFHWLLVMVFLADALPAAVPADPPGWQVLFQALIALAVLFYLSLATPEERSHVVRNARPLALPAFLLVFLVTLSYLSSQTLSRFDGYFLFEFLTCLSMIPLVALYCKTLRDFERMVYVVIAGGLLQLPIVLGQALGYADSLPGGLARLGASGGSLTDLAVSGSVARYFGSFGDYELLAEYSAIVLILCFGIVVFGLSSRRSLMVLGTVGAALVGWFTGTRGFALGALGGVAILAILAVFLSGRRFARVWRLAVLLFAVVVGILWLVPSQVTAGFLGRLALPNSSISGPNAFNRAPLFKTWISLAHGMPPLGYGADMMDRVHRAYPMLVSPHSLYFSILLSGGFPALAALILFVAVLLFTVLKVTLASPVPKCRRWGAVLTAVVAFWLVDEIKIEFLRLPFYMDFVFLVFGLIAALGALSWNRTTIDQAVTLKFKG